MSSQNENASFVAGLVVGSFMGVGLAVLLSTQTGEKIRDQLRNRSLALKDEVAQGLTEAGQHAQGQVSAWQEKGQAVTSAIGRSKDNLIQTVSDNKDQIEEAINAAKAD